MKKHNAVAALAALAQDNRLDVFRLLVQAGPDGMPAGRVAETLGLAPNTLTFHFDRLRVAGLVTVRRDGRSMIYAARFETMNGLARLSNRKLLPRRAGSMCARGGLQTGAREAYQSLSIGSATMKRFHVHVAVDDLKQSIGFYSALFAAEPAVIKTDYAKWMLDDPRVNFAISTRGRQPGLDHLGIQAESGDELKEIYARLHKAGGNIIEQGQTACCYAKSEKSWIDDPAGISWETFLTTGESIDYGDGTGERVARVAHEKSCCAPQVAAAGRRVRLPGRVRPCRGRSTIQRAVSLHRQFGPLHYGGSHLEQARRG